MVGIIFFLAVFIFIIWAIIHNSNKNDARRAKLKLDYQNALKGDDKKRALIAGRNYYGDLRNGKLTIYDEQAITNDLASMKTVEPEVKIQENPTQKLDSVSRLERLFELRQKGVLTEEEYLQQKIKILNE
jgi:hypothetical protein